MLGNKITTQEDINRPTCSLTDEQMKCDVYIEWNILFSLEKERQPSICRNMDERQGYYV